MEIEDYFQQNLWGKSAFGHSHVIYWYEVRSSLIQNVEASFNTSNVTLEVSQYELVVHAE